MRIIDGMIATEGALIDALGGTGAVAAKLDVKDSTVSGWRTRGFPPWAHTKLRGMADAGDMVVDPGLFEIQRPRARSVV